MTFIQSLRLPALLLGGALLSGGCGALDDEPDARDIIEEAAAAFEATSTARFSFDIDGTVALDDAGMLALGSVEGEAERPSNARAEASVQFGGSMVTMELVAVNGEMWLRNVVTGEWESAPTDLQYDPAAVFDETRGLTAILQQLEDPQTEGSTSLDGEDAWHVSATIATEAVSALTGNVFEADDLDVDLWIHRDDAHLLRVGLREIGVDDPLDWDIRLSDHGEPVEIAPPPGT